MQVEFRAGPWERHRRPYVDFAIEGFVEDKTFLGLLDSGANMSTLDSRIADAMGLPRLTSEAKYLDVGGQRHEIFESDVTLVVARASWTSRVRFAEGWNNSHMILGLHDVFELFKILIDADAEMTFIQPAKNDPRIVRRSR
jgi:hypothetical protein